MNRDQGRQRTLRTGGNGRRTNPVLSKYTRILAKKHKSEVRTAREVLKKDNSASECRTGGDSLNVEEALRKSIELLEFVQAQRALREGSKSSRTPERRPLCHSSTQTTEDKSIQVSFAHSSQREEIQGMKRSLRDIARTLREISGRSWTHDSATEMMTFSSPSQTFRRNCFCSSLSRPLLSDRKTHSPSLLAQDLHLSSLDSVCSSRQALNTAVDELELS